LSSERAASPVLSELPMRVRNFPFPFETDSYRYSANIEPAPRFTATDAGGWGGQLVDVDEGYADELALRKSILAKDTTRCVQLPHMRAAAWDTLLWGMQQLVAARPDQMSLSHDGERWHWRNGLLDIAQTFVFGEEATLPMDPLTYIGSQVQEDLVLLDQREDALWADAGLVTFAADWSMNFDLGMAFVDIHRPVPRVVPDNIIPRAQQFLMRLDVGEHYRRTNWTVTATPRLDVSTETYDEWGPARRHVVETGEYSARLRLRVEVQHFVRLAPSGAILFPIRTYQLGFEDLATVPPWRARLGAVLADLPPDMVDYKGMSRFRDQAVQWLQSA
jgi:hypothetical protein